MLKKLYFPRPIHELLAKITQAASLKDYLNFWMLIILRKITSAYDVCRM